MVEDVEKLAAELRIETLVKAEVLHQARVNIPESGRPHAVTACIAQSERRRSTEGGWIEPSVDTGIRHVPIADHIRAPAGWESHQRAAVADVVGSAGAHGSNPCYLPAAQQVIGGCRDACQEAAPLPERQAVHPVDNHEVPDNAVLRTAISGGVERPIYAAEVAPALRHTCAVRDG